MLIELHIIQSFVPSNLNRDDLNQPKECQFGGVRRARISSQCIKRAIRCHFCFGASTGVPNGKRTRLMATKILAPLLAPRLEAEEVALEFTKAYIKSMDRTQTAYLVFWSDKEASRAAARLLENWNAVVPGAENANKILSQIAEELIAEFRGVASAPDIALFGRMIADRSGAKINAACQVAHAISTHEVRVEDDYWTAVDDLQPEEQTGAGMLDYLGFNSACYYRYACVDWRQLYQNLAADYDLARRTVEGFLRASALAIPTGKRTAFAQNCEPAFLMAVVRQDGLAWNLANAFERPVTPQREGGVEGGFIAPSVKALEAHWSRLCRKFGQESLRQVSVWVADDALPLGSLSRNAYDRFDDWVASVVAALPDAEE